MTIPVNEHRNLVSGYNAAGKMSSPKLTYRDAIHGLTDGTWDVSDAIFPILEKTGLDRTADHIHMDGGLMPIGKSAYALLETDKIIEHPEIGSIEVFLPDTRITVRNFESHSEKTVPGNLEQPC